MKILITECSPEERKRVEEYLEFINRQKSFNNPVEIHLINLLVESVTIEESADKNEENS